MKSDLKVCKVVVTYKNKMIIVNPIDYSNRLFKDKMNIYLS